MPKIVTLVHAKILIQIELGFSVIPYSLDTNLIGLNLFKFIMAIAKI